MVAILQHFLQHEAAHFLVAYLLGVLPKDYRIYSYEHTKQRSGSVSFHGLEFLGKVSTFSFLLFLFTRTLSFTMSQVSYPKSMFYDLLIERPLSSFLHDCVQLEHVWR